MTSCNPGHLGAALNLMLQDLQSAYPPPRVELTSCYCFAHLIDTVPVKLR